MGAVALFSISIGALLLWRRKSGANAFELGRMGSRWRKSELADTSLAPVELRAEKEIMELPVNEIPAELHGSPSPVLDAVLR